MIFKVFEADWAVHFVFGVALQFCNDVLERISAEAALSLKAQFFVSFTIAFFHVGNQHLHAAEHEKEERKEEELGCHVEEYNDES